MGMMMLTFTVLAQIRGISTLKSANLTFQMSLTRMSAHVIC